MRQNSRFIADSSDRRKDSCPTGLGEWLFRKPLLFRVFFLLSSQGAGSWAVLSDCAEGHVEVSNGQLLFSGNGGRGLGWRKGTTVRSQAEDETQLPFREGRERGRWPEKKKDFFFSFAHFCKNVLEPSSLGNSCRLDETGRGGWLAQGSSAVWSGCFSYPLFFVETFRKDWFN